MPWLRVPAGELRVRYEDGATFVAARPEWAPAFEWERLDSPADVEALGGPPGGHDHIGAWAWIDERAGTVRARVFPVRYGIAEDEATGSAAVHAVRAPGPAARDPPGPRVAHPGAPARRTAAWRSAARARSTRCATTAVEVAHPAVRAQLLTPAVGQAAPVRDGDVALDVAGRAHAGDHRRDGRLAEHEAQGHLRRARRRRCRGRPDRPHPLLRPRACGRRRSRSSGSLPSGNSVSGPIVPVSPPSSSGTRAITPTPCSRHAGKSSSSGDWSKTL